MTMPRPRLFQRWAAEFQSTPMTNPGRPSLTWARQVKFCFPTLTVISSPGFKPAKLMVPLGHRAARTPPPSRTAATPNPGLMVFPEAGPQREVLVSGVGRPMGRAVLHARWPRRPHIDLARAAGRAL